MTRAFRHTAPLLLLFATHAAGQVKVDARLEKSRYLVGEPIVVIVDIQNVGGQPFGYSTCDGKVTLTVVDVERRLVPRLHGCYAGIGSAAGCAISHPPMLAPGARTSFRYLLKNYDLPAGTHRLSASGKAGVRGPVPGAEFERIFSLYVAAGSEDELKRAFAPLVTDADSPDPVRRYEARAAIVESAPRFLESLIARFAFEDEYNAPAIEALGRIASDESRSQLKTLFARNRDSRRQQIVLALAGIGHEADAEFFAGVLQDATADQYSRRYAALGLGYIGGDRAVRYLERALATVPVEIRPSIATALGNTRSRMAVPVLIGMFGNNPSRNEVCGALRTLTRRDWCPGTSDDPAATRRHWLREWNERGSTAQVYGPPNCGEEAPPPIDVGNPPSIIQVPKVDGPPRVTSVRPQAAFPNTIVTLSGYALWVNGTSAVRAFFIRDGVEHAAKVYGAGATGALQYLDVVVPETIAPGQWQIVIEARGERAAPVTTTINAAAQTVLTAVSPERPHPSQILEIRTRIPAQAGDQVELIDARGKEWRIATAISSHRVTFKLPDDVADGEATVRVGRIEGGAGRLSTPLTFVITSGPAPLKPSTAGGMKAVAPGQWTDLVADHEAWFEIRRADRIDVEFRQADNAIVSQAGGPDRVHVQVPAAMKPGPISVRTRTWIEQTASDWSAPADYRSLDRPVAPSIDSIEAGPVRHLTWWKGPDAPGFVGTKPGEALVLRGHFPVARASDLRAQLRGPGGTLDLTPIDVDGGVRVDVPARAAKGDWRLVVGPADGSTPPIEIATVRVM
jgi:hypothetical protein